MIDKTKLRLICDQCMKDAEIIDVQMRHGTCEFVVRCHDTTQVMDLHGYDPHTNGVLVWSNCEKQMWAQSRVRIAISNLEEALFRAAAGVQRYRSVLDGQDAPRICGAPPAWDVINLLRCAADHLANVRMTFESDAPPHDSQALYEAIEALIPLIGPAADRCRPRST